MRKARAVTLPNAMPLAPSPRSAVALAGVLVCLAAALSSAAAQGYTTAVGLRVGAGFGVSATQLVGRRHSLELIGQNRFATDAFTLTAIGRRHFNLGVRRVNFFLGGGLHKGWGYEDDGRRADPFGLTAQAGAELTLARTSVTFDFLPQLHLSGRVVPVSFGSAVGMRYVLVERKSRLRLRFPWETREEARKRRRAGDKRRKAREKARRRG